MTEGEKQHHENHKILSQKILAGIKETGDGILNSIKNADQTYWDKMIPSLLNHLIFDLQVAVHNFQQIEIKAKADKSAKADLQNVINIFSKIAYELQQELGKDLVVPKSFLETYIPQIIDVAQTLLGVIEEDKLHKFKAEQVELLNAILVALNQVSTTLQMSKPEEIKSFVERKVEQFNRVLDEIDFDNPNALENLKRHVNRANVQTPKIVHYLFKQSNNYDGKLKSEILKTADLVHVACAKITVDLQDSRDAREAEVHIRYIYNHFCSVMIRLITLLVADSKNLSVPDNVISLARYLGNQTIGILTRDIEYIRSDTIVPSKTK